jgi:hypothetical protein
MQEVDNNIFEKLHGSLKDDEKEQINNKTQYIDELLRNWPEGQALEKKQKILRFSEGKIFEH